MNDVAESVVRRRKAIQRKLAIKVVVVVAAEVPSPMHMV